jgi:hypothetical protein
MIRKVIWLGAVAMCGLGTGCVSLGPKQLRADQVDYARALGDAKKREILATIVGLRYADSPAFLNVSTIIAGYSFAANGGPTVNVTSPGATFAQAAGLVSYGNNPTFTFTPTTGEAYAAAYIRPLPPTLVLPLADGGIPIDLLLRITAQSIGGLQNGTMLGGPSSNGSPEFFELLRVLRRLQLVGELSVQYKETNHVGRVSFSIGAIAPGKEQAPEDVSRVRTLLNLSAKATEFDINYGEASSGDRIQMVTRSVLAILSNLGAQIEVPAEEISDGATKPTIELVGGEERPTIIVHFGKSAPTSAYVSVAYRGLQYWIERDDFDSKYAFTVVQDVMALAEVTDTTKAPVVTIPAN